MRPLEKTKLKYPEYRGLTRAQLSSALLDLRMVRPKIHDRMERVDKEDRITFVRGLLANWRGDRA